MKPIFLLPRLGTLALTAIAVTPAARAEVDVSKSAAWFGKPTHVTIVNVEDPESLGHLLPLKKDAPEGIAFTATAESLNKTKMFVSCVLCEIDRAKKANTAPHISDVVTQWQSMPDFKPETILKTFPGAQNQWKAASKLVDAQIPSTPVVPAVTPQPTPEPTTHEETKAPDKTFQFPPKPKYPTGPRAAEFMEQATRELKPKGTNILGLEQYGFTGTIPANSDLAKNLRKAMAYAEQKDDLHKFQRAIYYGRHLACFSDLLRNNTKESDIKTKALEGLRAGLNYESIISKEYHQRLKDIFKDKPEFMETYEQALAPTKQKVER